jgi:lipid-binding SYLF domain-containing protein
MSRHPATAIAVPALAWTCVLASALVGCAPARSATDPRDAREKRERAAQELTDATVVLDEMREIPAGVRERARCVAVGPSLVRAGFVVGARHGDGVVTCRTGGAWSAPVFITVTGGSAGPQIGVESSDVVMLVMSERGMSQLFRSSFALGADASASAGPAGGAAQAGTDASMTAEILSYARSRGLFAGAELSGSVVKQDGDALVAMYGTSADVPGILGGGVTPPPEAATFLDHVRGAFPPVPVALLRR